MKTTIKLIGFAVLVMAMVFCMAACVGPAGPDGVDGKDGADGKPGTAGETGDEGPAGPENVFTVTFDRGEDGTVTQPVIAGGWAVKPQDPAVRAYLPTTPGLYAGKLDLFYAFNWEKDDSPYDFATPVTDDFTLTAKWSEPAVVPVPVSGVAANNLKAAVDYVNTAANAGAYTLLIGTNIEGASDGRIENTTDLIDLTIIGIGEERTIQLAGGTNALLFNISTGVSLTLGNNITLEGKTGSTNAVVYVQLGGTLTMKAGAKITGHTTNITASAVSITGTGSKFIMEGGEISGNKSTNNDAYAIGGVFVNNSAQFVMSGGTISGNFNTNDSPADLYLTLNASFTLSGDASVGSLTLDGGSVVGEGGASVTLDKAYTGTVDALNLRRAVADIDSAISTWVNAPLIKAGTGYTLTASDIGGFTLGKFITNTAANDRPIAGNDLEANPTWANYRIADSGADIGKLVIEQ